MAALLGVVLRSSPGSAQLQCLETGQDLLRIPELRSHHGILRGTILLTDQEQRLAFRTPQTRPGQTGAVHECAQQHVRIFRGVGAVVPGYPGMVPPGYPNAGSPRPPSKYPDPIPGPTLRASVGDIVQLTLLNQIEARNLGLNIDRAEKGQEDGCDRTNGIYPDGVGDKFPNCFHASSTGNIHFHGTHTNPNTTGDNVFIQVRPSLRERNGDPVVTARSVKASFDVFFAECERQLRKDVLAVWPKTWEDIPKLPRNRKDAEDWTNAQKRLLEKYDRTVPKAQRLSRVNAQQVKDGLWPQYYIGAYPFCFQLPEYKGDTWPPKKGPRHERVHMGLPEDEGRLLQMGQAPGTHWYHAHKHGSTAINVANGLTGAFIIEGKYDHELNQFYGKIDGEDWTRRQPVLVINQLGVSPNLERPVVGRARMGEDFSVNGRLQPKLTMRPGEVQLWRIVNTSARSGVRFLGPPKLAPEPAVNPKLDFQWKQLAKDGVQFSDLNYQDSKNHDHSFLLAAGNRADLLVRAPSTAPGQPVAVQVRHTISKGLTPRPPLTSDWVTFVLVEVAGPVVADTDPQGQFIKNAPSFLPFLEDIADEEVRSTKTITFESAGFNHTIDGEKFDAKVGQVVRLNTVEEWKVENRTVIPAIDHPFHIHINPFQVVEEFDPNEVLADGTTSRYVFEGTPMPGQCLLDITKPSTWKPCDSVPRPRNIWHDVYPIPAGRSVPVGQTMVVVPGYFKMRSRFVDYPGWFVMHCHILAHEDRGMMTVVHVAPFTSPVSHH